MGGFYLVVDAPYFVHTIDGEVDHNFLVSSERYQLNIMGELCKVVK